MSDPVAKDVEDVLSSIRRLVSDTGPEAAPRVTQKAAPEPDLRDALILTSALRVKEEDEAALQEDASRDAVPPYEVATDEGETLAEALDRIEGELATEGEAAGQDVAPDDEYVSDAVSDDLPEGMAEDPDVLSDGSDLGQSDLVSGDPAPSDLASGDLTRSDLGSLRQAVSGAFIGEPVMPAVVHTTQNVKKAADVSSAIETTKNWGARAPEDYYEDEELLASDLPAADLSEWTDDDVAEDTADVAETDIPATDITETKVQVAGADDAEGESEDVHAFREDAPEQGEDWTDAVEPETAEDAVSEELEDEGAEHADLADTEIDTDAPDTEALIEDDADTAAATEAGDISDEYEWDEEREEGEDPVNIATFRHTPVDTAQRIDPLPLVAEGAAVVDDKTSEDAAADTAQLARSEEAPTEASDTAAQAPEPKPTGLGDIDETVLDEETLRELVSDIVRKELTGELGERITRNVRKLVRREIHRALATREFD
jgi:hypothetical protein